LKGIGYINNMSTLKVDTILKRTGTGTITVGQSGDTVALPSATLTTALPVASGGTGGTSFSAAGLANTPAFQVTLGSNDTISNDTYTKLDFGSETLDTDSAFASGKFTVPSGKDGVYFFSSAITLDGDSSSNLTSAEFRFHKNGSNAGNGVGNIFSNNPIRYTSLASSIKISLVAGDYMEIYASINSEDSSGGRVLSGSSFSGQKLIGA